MSRKHDIITIKGEVYSQTENAYLFSDGSVVFSTSGPFAGTNAEYPGLKKVWLPKSQCEWDPQEKEMQLPEWLALEKGLI